MSRGPQTSLKIHREVKRLLTAEGVTSKNQIYDELDRLGHIDAHGRPSKRTIERLVDRLKPADVSGLWSLAEEVDAEAAGLVLDVLASVMTAVMAGSG